MNITIAVALITAIATLSGGCIAMVTGLVVQRRQLQLQISMSTQERIEQQGKQQHQIRRDAYVELLTQFDQLLKLFDQCWMGQPPPLPDANTPASEEVFSQINKISIALNIVYLEGPESVRWAARSLVDVINEEWKLINSLFRKNAGNPQRLVDLNRDACTSAEEVRTEAKKEFVDEAAKVLNNLPELPWNN